jgi:hypothetical protein
MKRSGIADLPLHGGRVPEWLAHRMTRLGTAITRAIVYDYGTSAFLSRLSDPFWFQAFGAVMGMDWHSSGITTSVMGALKRGLASSADELGLYICGGRGRFSRNTPNELRSLSDRLGCDGEALVRTSRLTARVDNNAIADGFQIYLHSFVLARNGEWAVVQQGTERSKRHGPPIPLAFGLSQRFCRRTAHRNRGRTPGNDHKSGRRPGAAGAKCDAKSHTRAPRKSSARGDIHSPRTIDQKPVVSRYLRMPAHHEVREDDVDLKRLGAVLAIAYERDLHDFAELLLTEKLGPRTLQSLALVAEVIHGTPARFDDPARFSFAHGGKDGIPSPCL